MHTGVYDVLFVIILGDKICSECYLSAGARDFSRTESIEIWHFDDLSSGFTPRLHLLKVNCPRNDESTLCDAGCFLN